MTLPLSRFACLSVFLLFLAGCMTVPISSIPKLMRQDFLTMDFEHVRVGLQLPADLSLRSGDAVMITRSRTDGSRSYRSGCAVPARRVHVSGAVPRSRS